MERSGSRGGLSATSAVGAGPDGAARRDEEARALERLEARGVHERQREARRRLGEGLEVTGVVEEVGAFPLLWCAVDVEDELFVALVPHLQGRARLNRDDAERTDVDPIGRVGEQHRQRAGDDHEDLFLRLVGVALAARPRRVAPDSSEGLREGGHLRDVGRVPRRLTFDDRGALFPLELRRVGDVIGHDAILRVRENVTMGLYHEQSRKLQDRFDTRRLADRIEERIVHDRIDDDDRVFIEARDMFFIATVDEEGRPQCSYKGGEPGFVRVLDERTIAFPIYNGNGMYLTTGNLLATSKVGLLFIDFEERRRMRLNGDASVDDDDPLLAEYPEAQLIVRVAATEVFPNCPRYIHEYRLVAHSRFVPRPEFPTPVPAWKHIEGGQDVLPENEPALVPGRNAVSP